MGLTRPAVVAAIATTIATTAALLAGCGHGGALTGDSTHRGVRVQVRVEGDHLTATFTPQRPGFHVYSVDLPARGIDGLGVPTRLSPEGALSATGAVRADRPVRSLAYPSLGVRLPVYPDGPVTLHETVRRSTGRPWVLVTYAACSSSLCLPPVRGLEVTLHDEASR